VINGTERIINGAGKLHRSRVKARDDKQSGKMFVNYKFYNKLIAFYYLLTIMSSIITH